MVGLNDIVINGKTNRQLIRPEMGGAVSIFDKKIWRVKDVASFLDCTIGHIYNLASDEKIPKRKKNGMLFFIPQEILNWVFEGD